MELCNHVPGETAQTQHRFDWLLGSPGYERAAGQATCRRLRHFGKPDRLTVSGVHRPVRRDTRLPVNAGHEWSESQLIVRPFRSG